MDTAEVLRRVEAIDEMLKKHNQRFEEVLDQRDQAVAWGEECQRELALATIRIEELEKENRSLRNG